MIHLIPLSPVSVLVAFSLITAATAAAQSSAGSSTIRFEDITAQSGLQFVVNNSASGNKNQPETNDLRRRPH